MPASSACLDERAAGVLVERPGMVAACRDRRSSCSRGRSPTRRARWCPASCTSSRAPARACGPVTIRAERFRRTREDRTSPSMPNSARTAIVSRPSGNGRARSRPRPRGVEAAYAAGVAVRPVAGDRRRHARQGHIDEERPGDPSNCTTAAAAVRPASGSATASAMKVGAPRRSSRRVHRLRPRRRRTRPGRRWVQNGRAR